MANPPAALRVGAAALLLASISLTAPRASAACPPDAERWAATCAQRAGLAVSLGGCPAGSMLVHVPDGSAAPLVVEISGATPASFRAVGGLALAPVGDFADWASEPLARRRAFDAVVECVRVAPPALDLSEAREPHAGPARRAAIEHAPVPWLLVALGGIAAGLLALHRRDLRVRRAAPLIALALSTLLVRALVLPRAFFHQNGQGPGWVDAAWQHRTSSYGAGFTELFAALCGLSPAAPEAPVFWAQAIAGATIPLLAFALGRAASASRAIAWGFAFAMAVDPLAARLAQSESYYLTIEWLLFCATALSVFGARPEAKRSEAALCFLGAGLAVAQAARVHPIGWIPAALVPLAVLATRRDARQALRPMALATATIGGVVALTTGPAMLRTIRGQLGEHWIPVAGTTFGRDLRGPVLCALGALGVIALALLSTRRTARASLYLCLALLGLVAATATGSNLVGSATRAVNEAYRYLFAPVVVCALARVAALAAGRRDARVVALAVATSAAAYAIHDARAACTLPTDARELAWAQVWRRSLPVDGAVHWVERAPQRVLNLPLYEGSRTPAPRPIVAGVGDAPIRRNAFYYRSSLCSTPEGRDACDAFERAHRLTLVERRTLPALASLPSLPLEGATVEVALFRVSAEP